MRVILKYDSVQSPTMYPKANPLTIGGAVLKESAYLNILGVTFYSKLVTFYEYHRSVSRAW